MEQLIITIKGQTVVVEVNGVKGSRCLQLTQALEQLIGQTDSRLLKKNFHSQSQIAHTISAERVRINYSTAADSKEGA